MTATPMHEELLALNQRLLDAIARADWSTYAELCDPGLTAFEPESCGYLVEGMDFHRYYFDLGASEGPRHTTMASPHVRLLNGDVAVITYVRLVQYLSAGVPHTSATQETRIWHRQGGGWRHVHFHRSRPSP